MSGVCSQHRTSARRSPCLHAPNPPARGFGYAGRCMFAYKAAREVEPSPAQGSLSIGSISESVGNFPWARCLCGGDGAGQRRGMGSQEFGDAKLGESERLKHLARERSAAKAVAVADDRDSRAVDRRIGGYTGKSSGGPPGIQTISQPPPQGDFATASCRRRERTERANGDRFSPSLQPSPHLFAPSAKLVAVVPWLRPQVSRGTTRPPSAGRGPRRPREMTDTSPQPESTPRPQRTSRKRVVAVVNAPSERTAIVFRQAFSRVLFCSPRRQSSSPSSRGSAPSLARHNQTAVCGAGAPQTTRNDRHESSAGKHPTPSKREAKRSP
jgi:hypothetical protein